ncbi:TadE/TadG family type IV pilus assembly protein [Thiohalocapsa marina]|nr:TadE/TadG family type IV pilus assembly protein [Thiohalocapsa marina]
MVEMAIVLPLFLFLSFGIIETANAMRLYMSMVYAAEDAARYASLHGSGASVPATSDSIAAQVRDFPGLSNATVTTLWTATENAEACRVPDDASGSDWATSPTGRNDPGSLVCVWVERTYRFMTPIIPDLDLKAHMERVVTGA